MRIEAIRKVAGEIYLPGDKSLSHRLLLLAALAQGDSLIVGVNTGKDVASTMGCLKALGIKFRATESGVKLCGKALQKWQNPEKVLDAGNSGTTMRLLAGLLANLPFPVEIKGDSSLNRRPMDRIIEPLSLMGARVSSDHGFPPLRFHPSQLHALKYQGKLSSAQVKSCLLLAALSAGVELYYQEPFPSRDHTERLFQALGIPISAKNGMIHLPPFYGEIKGFECKVPGDPSSGAFLAALAALLPESRLVLKEVLLNPTRIAFYHLLRKMGANVNFEKQGETMGEPYGDIVISGVASRAIVLQPEEIPALIDELPLIALLATQCEGETVIRGAGELRYKESDRIGATAQNLKIAGAEVEELPDGMMIKGPTRLKGGDFKSHGDHRIALCAVIAAAISQGESWLDDPDCIAISFPGFFQLLEQCKG